MSKKCPKRRITVFTVRVTFINRRFSFSYSLEEHLLILIRLFHFDLIDSSLSWSVVNRWMYPLIDKCEKMFPLINLSFEYGDLYVEFRWEEWLLFRMAKHVAVKGHRFIVLFMILRDYPLSLDRRKKGQRSNWEIHLTVEKKSTK